MLSGNNNGIYANRFSVLIFNGNLSLSVGTEVFQRAFLSHLCQLLCEAVSKRYGKRHKLGGLVAGVAEHHALVAGADPVVYVVLTVFMLQALVNAHSDIG